MGKVLAAIVLALASPVFASEVEQSVIVGVPGPQEFINSINCEPDFCMDAFYRWSISVERQVAGPEVPRKLRAVRVQHAENLFTERRPQLLFVLEPIEDPAARARYGAEYFVEALGWPAQVFCLSGRTQKPDLSKLEQVGKLRGKECYAEPAR